MPHLSTLQISLIVIGAVLVLAVWGYNMIQERRIRKRMDAAFKTQADPLPDTPVQVPATRADVRERMEPRFASGGYSGDDPPIVNRAGDVLPAQPEHDPAADDIAQFDSDALAVEPAGAELPDPDVECVARLQAAQPIPGVVLMDAVEYAYAKPCRWLGRETSGVWSPVRDSVTYTEIAACLLLADRSGPLNEHEYAKFRQVIEGLAAALPAAFVIGDRADEVRRAAAIDAFCADVDIQIGLNLQRKDGGRWTGTRLRGVAEAAGFKLNGAGALDYVAEDTGLLLFRMQNREDQPLLAESMKLLSTGGVTLLLDVPRAADPVKAFDQMRALSKRLAVTLDAELVDDNGRPLTDAGLGTIRSQLSSVQATMRAKGIEPGSARALRLFG